MSECNDNTSCNTNKDTCDSSSQKSNSQCTMAEDLLCLAKQAKKELLKEKMKAHFEAKKGKKLDKIAEIAVDAAIQCIEHQMAGKEACDEYKQNLQAAFKS